MPTHPNPGIALRGWEVLAVLADWISTPLNQQTAVWNVTFLTNFTLYFFKQSVNFDYARHATSRVTIKTSQSNVCT